MAALGGSRTFKRRRTEPWTLAARSILSVVELSRGDARAPQMEIATGDAITVVIYAMIAGVLAVPCLAVQVLDAWKSLRIWSGSRSGSTDRVDQRHLTPYRRLTKLATAAQKRPFRPEGV